MKFMACMALVVLVGCGQIHSETKVRASKVLRRTMPNPQLLDKINRNARQLRNISRTILSDSFSMILIEQYRDLLVEMYADTEQAYREYNSVQIQEYELLHSERVYSEKLYRKMSRAYHRWLREVKHEFLYYHALPAVEDLDKLVKYERHYDQLSSEDREKLKEMLPVLKETTNALDSFLGRRRASTDSWLFGWLVDRD